MKNYILIIALSTFALPAVADVIIHTFAYGEQVETNINKQAKTNIEFVKIPGQDWSIGKYEVTQAQYAAVMGKPFKESVKESWLKDIYEQEKKGEMSPGSFPKNLIDEIFMEKGGMSNFFADNKPAIFVSWNDAMKFCKILTMRERVAGRLPAGYKYTLPTSKQWEIACRAGTTTSFCSGNAEGDLYRVAWYVINSDRKTHPVGTKEPNAWGIHDMHGNVEEWCLDEDPRYLPDRVCRGGSYDCGSGFCESSSANIYDPDYHRRDYLGFRVVLVPAGE